MILPRQGIAPDIKAAGCITSPGCSRAGQRNVMPALQALIASLATEAQHIVSSSA